MDWRFQNQKWQRRCRYVAREFRAGDKGSAATFAPTSGVGARLVLVARCCFQWLLAFLYIKDAFLLVPSVRRFWWRNPLGGLMDQAHIGSSANACLDREMLLHVSLISFVSIYKLLEWRTRHYCQACLGTRKRSWPMLTCRMTWWLEVSKKQYNGLWQH